MKKIRVLIAAIIIALLAMGVGYATWTQTLNINVVGDTSMMNVKFIDASTVHDKYTVASAVISGGAVQTASPAPKSPVIGNEGTRVDVLISQLYPGDMVTIHTTIKNDSTMPVNMYQFIFGDIKASAPELLNDVSVGFGLTGEWRKLGNGATIPCDIDMQPGDTVDFTFYVKLDAASGNATQSQNFSFTINPGFVNIVN